MYNIPKIFEQFPDLLALETTRHGGLSQKPYASLNLGFNSGDDLELVTQNRKLLYDRLGIREKRVIYSNQIHKDHILVATRCGAYDGYDALITQNKNAYLNITVADCTPILIYDPVEKVVAAIHAGWKGTVAQLVAKTIQRMERTFKTKAKNCFAYVGTCIDERSFEVDIDVAQEFTYPFKRYDAHKKKFFVDLKGANKAQLLNSGIPENQIEVSPYSTVLHNQDFFSYRKEKGKTGRMIALIGMKK